MLLKRTARFLAGLVVALGAAPSRAQVPVGPEFVVSESSVSGYVSVAAGPAADFAVAWEDYGPVDLDPMARRYNAKGLAVGPAFTTTLGTGDQFHPAVASDGGSRFVVAWIDGVISNHEEPSIKGRRFDSLGRALGPEFQLDSGFTTRAFSGAPQVSMAPDGRFVAVWPTRTSPSTVGVAARRCNARECLGPEFDVNAFTTGFPAEPDVAVHADGSFVVAWRVIRDGGGSGVFARLFDATGAARPSIEIVHQRGVDIAAAGEHQNGEGALHQFPLHTSPTRSLTNCLLNIAGMNMMSQFFTGARLAGIFGSRE